MRLLCYLSYIFALFYVNLIVIDKRKIRNPLRLMGRSDKNIKCAQCELGIHKKTTSLQLAETIQLIIQKVLPLTSEC